MRNLTAAEEKTVKQCRYGVVLICITFIAGILVSYFLKEWTIMLIFAIGGIMALGRLILQMFHKITLYYMEKEE